MKKLFYMTVFIVISLTLFGCRPAYQYEYDTLTGKVKKVEIIEITDSQLESEATIIKTLNAEETDELLSGLSKLKFEYPFGDPPSMNGYCIRIYYQDEKYEVISHRITKRYDQEGENIAMYNRRCSKKDFDNLISQFI